MTQAGDAASRIALPPVLDAAAASILLAQLRAATDPPSRLVLDASHVDEIGTPAIQVIEAAARHLERAGFALGFALPSDAFCAAYADLGMFAALMQRLATDG